MPILNYTTAVDAAKTVAEIQTMLVKAGATRVMIDYETGEPSALIFELHSRPFRLPCKWQAVQKILRSDAKSRQHGVTDARARRVAWRIIRNWVEAQLAIIETGMVATEEVFLPYLLVNNTDTAYDVYLRSDRQLTLKGS